MRSLDDVDLCSLLQLCEPQVGASGQDKTFGAISLAGRVFEKFLYMGRRKEHNTLFYKTGTLMNKINLTKNLLLVMFISMWPIELQAQSDRPNVVIVITDDQGYGDLSCHGNPILKTPQLDQLYEQSIRLTNYHVSPTCSPSRASLMTGHWSNRTGVWHTIMGRSMLRENEVTMGQVFQKAGYSTGMFGKWHLGDNYPYRPEDRGFEEVLRHGGGGVGQTPDYWNNAYFDGHYWHNGVPEAAQGFCTDVFFDYAKEFIKAQKKLDKPFLAYISTNAPHGPMHCPEDFSKPYAEQGVHVANFLGMIANIDQNVGSLRQFLIDEGLNDNTIFIFTTDNGTSSGDKIFNAQMRGRKGSEFDGGHRVPLFIHWPKGQIQEGRDIGTLTAHVDVLPTIMNLCDIESSDFNFDGRDLTEILGNKSVTQDWNQRVLITDSQRVKDPIKWRKSAVMSGPWRLINGKELYQMTRDPSQQSNVAADHPHVVTRLRQSYDQWWEELEPSFAEETAIYLGHPDETPARLTSHDWITQGSTPWNQAQVRRAINAPEQTGYWNVNVFEAGTYEIVLRRWPRESNLAIDEPAQPEDDVPGVKAMRTQPGKAIEPESIHLKIGEQEWEKPYSSGQQEIAFQVDLVQGVTRLSGRFVVKDGTQYGAYYAYVKQIE